MDEVELEFHAEDSGVFPMTWGQVDIWTPIKWYGEASSYFNIPMFAEVQGVDRTTALTAMRRLVERNQSLRAHFRDGSDGAQQEIAARGTFTVRLRESTPEQSRADAEALATELAVAQFDHTAEWPIRMALICADGVPVQFVFAAAHLAADGGGIAAIVAEFRDLLAGEPEPARRRQPIDEVRHEQSKRGVRRNHAAVDYFRKQLTSIAPSMFCAPPVPPAQPRFHRLRLESAAMAAAVRRLAADLEVSPPSVVLAGMALALTTLTGHCTAVLNLIVSNRYDDQMRGMIAATAQDGLLVVSFTGGTVADAIRATHKAALTGYFYGYYNPVDVDAVIEAVAAERGVKFDLTSYFNDLTPLFGDREGTAGPVPDEARARELLADSTVVHEAAWETQDSKFFVEADCGPCECHVDLLGDTAYIPLPRLETILRGVDALLVAAACRDVPISEVPVLTGITPVPIA